MADEFFTYDPEAVILTWGGLPITGFHDGTIIRVEYDEDAVTKTVGTTGAVTATVNANRSARCTFTLSQGAELNGTLSRLTASTRPRNSRTKLVVRAFMLKELGGETIAEGPSAWLVKVAASEYAKEAGPREWMLDIASLKMTTGGNIITA